jgi:hypothetical protein
LPQILFRNAFRGLPPVADYRRQARSEPKNLLPDDFARAARSGLQDTVVSAGRNGFSIELSE